VTSAENSRSPAGAARTFDVETIRAQFPILAREVNGTAFHYLDNAATTQVPQTVLDAIIDHETRSRANVLRGVHALAEAATKAYESARGDVARYIGAAPEEVVFTSGTTGSLNLLAHSFGERLGEGDEIVLSLLEHHSNIVPWQILRDRRGVTLKFLPVTAEGRIDTGALESLVTPRTRLISLGHVSNVTGAELDVGAVVEAARSVGALVALDGAQRAAHGAFDVQALGVDFYAFSSHKMFGPNGVGVLWGRAEALADLPPFHGGGEMIARVTPERSTYAEPPMRFEAGTPPIAQAVGLGAAVRWIEATDSDAIGTHLRGLTLRVIDGLAALGDRARLIGPGGSQSRYPVVSFVIDGAHPHDLCQVLDGHGVALRGGHHCAQPYMDHLGVTGTTRGSLALYNDESDLDALLNGLEDAIRRLT